MEATMLQTALLQNPREYRFDISRSYDVPYLVDKDIVEPILVEAVLPVVVALFLYSIFSRIFVDNGTLDFFLIWLACGVPFGIGKMFTLIPIGFGISGTVGVVALNIVLGGLIGGVILIYRLAVAVWYLPLTIYRLVA